MDCMLPILKILVTCNEVCFSRTKLNVGKVKTLTRDVDLLKRMVSIDVSDCALRCTATKLLLNGLKHCSNLKVLRMNDNKMDQAGIKALAKFLSDCNCNLSELSIDNCSRLDIRYEELVLISEGLKQPAYLKVLNMAIGTDGCKVIARALTHNNTLEVLSMYSNPIKDEAVMALMDALQNCTTVRTLNLSECMFGSEGIKAVAESLKLFGSLEVLMLNSASYTYSIRISSDGAKALADNFQYCHNLQTLNLSRTNINDNGEAICRELKHCTQLCTLNLSNNHCLTVSTAVCLGESLKHCKGMQFLHLQRNKLSNEGAMALAEGLKCYKS